MPVVSIIVPVYNVEAYVERAINSIIEQSYVNIEIILIDDGSTDKSGFLCDKMQQIDNRIVVEHQLNQGVSSARNRGLKVSAGEYILFVDADDEISPMMVEEMVNIMITCDADLVVCGMNQIYIDENGDKCKEIELLLEREGWYNSLFFIANMRSDDIVINNNCEVLWNKLFKKNLFRDELSFFDTSINYVEDGNFLLDLFSREIKIYYIKKSYYNYYSYHMAVRKSSMHSFLQERFEIYKSLYLKQLKYGFNKFNGDELAKCKHDYINRVILAIILLCRTEVHYTYDKLRNVIYNMINDPTVIDAMAYYKRKANNSWTVPLLIKLKKVDHLIYFARKIVRKRY